MTHIQQDLPQVIENLKKAQSKEACLYTAYEVLTTKYRGYRGKTYLYLADLFITNIDKLWSKNGFLHCTNLNKLLKTLLVASGWFTEEEVKSKWALIWYVSPHQYLRIKLGKGHYMNIDMWGKVYGIPFGGYAHGFNTKVFSNSSS